MISFETDVRIGRSIEDVFAYVSNPGNFRDWNSAVVAVREREPGSTYVMERQLPTGRAVNELRIVTLERPNEFTIRTTSGPTPFSYVYRFSEDNGGTVVRLDAEVELEGVASFLSRLASRAVKKGVDDNLAALKEILEGGSQLRPGEAMSDLRPEDLG